MSLFERLAEAAGSETKFKDSPGTDAFQHSDRSKKGRRNNSPVNFFKGKNQRFPAWNSWASTAGSIRQACQGDNADPGVCKDVQAFAKKRFKVCTTDDGECEKRDHGPGGPPEHKTACQGKHCDLPPDHGGRHPWPFQHKGSKKWDKKWSALGKKEEFLPRRNLLSIDVQEELHPAVKETAKLAGKTFVAPFAARRKANAKRLSDLMAKNRRLAQGHRDK